jgi:predicted transport protein
MAIFKEVGKKLIPIDEVKLESEKDLQVLTEDNLEAVFGLKFIYHEFSLNGLRIDTLAFNEETSSFVIIEYKRDRSFSIVDQGFSYLSLMLNNKADFILEYAKKTKIDLDKIKIDWSQSRVLFLANSFTSHQLNAVNFKDLPIELWKVRKFDNETILYNQVESSSTSESINKISKNKIIEKVSREVKKRTIESHFKEDWVESRELFEIVRERILNLDSRIEENPNPTPYIGYKIGNSNLVSLHIYKSKIVICLSKTHPKDIKDPDKKAVLRLNSKKHYNQHLTDVIIKDENDIDYAMFLVKQVYNKFYK